MNIIKEGNIGIGTETSTTTAPVETTTPVGTTTPVETTTTSVNIETSDGQKPKKRTHSKKARFTSPTEDEVRAYAKQVGIDKEGLVDFFIESEKEAKWNNVNSTFGWHTALCALAYNAGAIKIEKEEPTVEPVVVAEAPKSWTTKHKVLSFVAGAVAATLVSYGIVATIGNIYKANRINDQKSAIIQKDNTIEGLVADLENKRQNGENLQNSINAANQSIAALQGKVDGYEIFIGILTAQIKNSNSAVEIENLTRQIEEKDAEIGRLNGIITDLKVQLTNATKKYNKLTTRYEEDVKHLNEVINGLNLSNEEKDKIIEKQGQTIADMSQTIIEQKAIIAGYEDRIITLNSQIEGLKAQIEGAVDPAYVAELKTKLAAAQEEITALGLTSVALQEQVDSLTTLNNNLVKANKALGDNNAKLLKENAVVSAANKELRRKVSELQTANSELTEEVSAKESALKQAQADLTAAQTDLDNKTAEYDALYEQYLAAVASGADTAELEKLLIEKDNKIKDQQATIKSQSAEIEQLQSDYQTVSDRLTASQNALIDAVAENAELRAAVDSLDAANRKYQAEIAEKDGKIMALKITVNDQEQDISDLNGIIKGLRDELVEQAGAYVILEKKAADLESEVKRLEEEKEAIRASKELSDKEKGEALAALADEQQAKDNLRRELDDAINENNAKAQEIRRLLDTIYNLENTAAQIQISDDGNSIIVYNDVENVAEQEETFGVEGAKDADGGGHDGGSKGPGRGVAE